jgi:tetratricopeptide (TPR) repeat protein
MIRTTALAACAMAFLLTGVAEAKGKAKKAVEEQPPAARPPAARLYEEGMAAYDAGKYEEALAAFTESYNLSGETGLLYNLAVCSERTGREEKAIAYYELYLEENPDTEDAADVKARLESLRKPADAAAPPAGEETPPAPEETPPEETPPETAQATRADVVTDLDAIDAAQAGKAPVGPAVVVGAGGLVLAAGILTAISAYKKYGDLESSCSPDCTDAQLEPTRSTALAADILMISGGVAVAAGALWWIMTAREERPDPAAAGLRAAPVATSNGGGLFLEGSF